MTKVVFGAIDDLGSKIGRYAAVSQDIPWRLVKDRIGGEPSAPIMTEGLEHDYLEELLRRTPQVDTIVGIGGGVAIDTAKYLAWRRGCRLIFVPTIISVDAYVTPAAAVRYSGKVNYTGSVAPDQIIIDFKAIRAAPVRLNTAGAGDIYSCRTALFDWKLARDKKGESFDEEIAAESERILEKLASNAHEIRRASEAGIRTLVELHLETNRIQIKVNSPRPEEGSEHLFFYTLEEQLHRSFVHGEVVGTGIYIMTHFQSQEEELVAKEMNEMGLLFSPKNYGITRDEFADTILQIKRYVRETNFMYTIMDEIEVTRQDCDELWRKLDAVA